MFDCFNLCSPATFSPARRSRFFPALAALLVFAPLPATPQHSPAGAQNSTSDAVYTIRREVRRVVLDVVVTDAHHNHVHGLTRKDFSVLENKQPQEIRSFEEFDFNAPTGFVTPKPPPLPPGTYMDVQTREERGPLYVIVYDAVHMYPADQTQARKQLEEFVRSKPEGTRFALFLLGQDFRMLQGFTTDPSQLLQAFDVHRKEGHIPNAFLMNANFGGDDPLMPYEVMTFLGHYLDGLPGRKNLIWLSSAFPAAVPLFGLQAMQTLASAPNGSPVGNTMAPAQNAMFQGQGFDSSAPVDIGESWDAKVMRKAIDALNAAQVSVYPVDVAGLKPELRGIDELADHIAAATGGRSYYNTNDFKEAMTRATEDGSSYYEITYAPADPRYDSQVRNIQIKLSRSGYQLGYRQFYYAEDPDQPLTHAEAKMALAVADQVVAHKPGDSMFAYMQHGAPEAHQILFRAEIHAGPRVMATPEQMAGLVQQPAYFVIRKKGKPAKLPAAIPLRTYTIDYLVLDQVAARQHGGQQVLEFGAGAYNSMGQLLNGISQNAVRQTGEQKGRQPLFRAEQTLDIPTDAAWIRLAVRDVKTDQIGTLELPLPLPDGGAPAARSPAQASAGAAPAQP